MPRLALGYAQVGLDFPEATFYPLKLIDIKTRTLSKLKYIMLIPSYFAEH